MSKSAITIDFKLSDEQKAELLAVIERAIPERLREYEQTLQQYASGDVFGTESAKFVLAKFDTD